MPQKGKNVAGAADATRERPRGATPAPRSPHQTNPRPSSPSARPGSSSPAAGFAPVLVPSPRTSSVPHAQPRQPDTARLPAEAPLAPPRTGTLPRPAPAAPVDSVPPQIAPEAATVCILVPYPPLSRPAPGDDDAIEQLPDPAARQAFLSHISDELSRLLRLDFAAFWSTVLWPNSDPRLTVPVFLQSYRDNMQRPPYDAVNHLDGPNLDDPSNPAVNPPADPPLEPIEVEIGSKVFRLICRLTMAPEDEAFEASGWTIEKWGAAIRDHDIISAPTLFDIARIYSRDNKAVVRRMFGYVLASDGRFLEDLGVAADIVIDEVHRIQKKYEKSSKGKGKGKGKGKASAGGGGAGAGLGGGAEPSAEDKAATAAALAHADLLLDAAWDFDAILRAGSKKVADVFLAHPAFVPSLVGAYEVANILQASVDSGVRGSPEPTRLPIGEEQDATPMSKEAHDVWARARDLKHAVLTLVKTFMEAEFLDAIKLPGDLGPDLPEEEPDGAPPGYNADFPALPTATPTPATEPAPVLTPEELLAVVDSLGEFLINLIELCPFDGPVEHLRNAPLLVDLEVELGLADKISAFRVASSHSIDDADTTRMRYVVASLEQLLTFSGNAEARSAYMNRQRRIADIRADAARGSALPHSALAAQVAPMSEDYIRRTSLISQVQDLFGELGDGFIEACLMAFDDNVETVIMMILENNLPDQVAKLDRQMARTAPVRPPFIRPVAEPQLALVPSRDSSLVPVDDVPDTDVDTPPSTDLLSSRRNVFDGDEFDLFAHKKIDTRRVVFGKKEKTVEIANDRSYIADVRDRVYESQYDDEYDDTYDSLGKDQSADFRLVDEAENALDRPSAGDRNDSDPTAGLEPELISLYTTSPNVFSTSARKTLPRENIKARLGLSDEQIEGWAKMFARN
ncbi:hypothetical protein BDK51DRAFT_35298, partial [Blyttiomyces helicus]